MKERQLKKLQMFACKQISSEVKDTVKPMVFTLAKESVLSLSNDIVPEAVKETLSDLT